MEIPIGLSEKARVDQVLGSLVKINRKDYLHITTADEQFYCWNFDYIGDSNDLHLRNLGEKAVIDMADIKHISIIPVLVCIGCQREIAFGQYLYPSGLCRICDEEKNKSIKKGKKPKCHKFVSDLIIGIVGE